MFFLLIIKGLADFFREARLPDDVPETVRQAVTCVFASGAVVIKVARIECAE